MDSRNGRHVGYGEPSYRNYGGRGNNGRSYNQGRRPGPCFAFQRGECRHGEYCRYSHNEQYGGAGQQRGDRGGRGGDGFTPRPPPGAGRGRGGGKKPDSMMERPGYVAIPEAVNIVNVLVVGIGNFTDPEALVNLASSVQEVAELLVEQGDLETYAEAISDIFVKCFSQLTMQSPAIATLLSLIAKSNRAFPTLVLEKLSVQLMTALQSGDVVVARNHLRSLCCLASAGCVSVDGHGQGVGIVQVLGALCDVAEEESGSSMAVGVEAAIYLLASCVPYVFTALLDAPSPQSAKLAANIAALCRRVTSQDEDGSRRISLFDTDGAQPVFMAAIDGTAAPVCTGDSTTAHSSQEGCPPGAVCWDSLWEVCKVADNILTSIDATAGASLTGANVPQCLLLLWYNADLLEPLKQDVAQPKAAPADESAAEEAPKVLPARITLDCLDPASVSSTVSSAAFGVLAGPVVDFYAAPTHTTGTSKTERAKSGNNACQGYGSWMAVRFNVFDEDISEDCVKALTSLSLLQLVTARDYFRSVLRFFEPFIRDDGTRVGSITLLCEHLLSVYQFFPADVHLEYVLLDTLLMMIVQVPAWNPSLVERVVLELCVRSPQVPAVLAIVCCAMYEFIPAMNVVSWRQLSSFLSGHLCNTHLAWPYWTYWGEEYAATVSSEDFAAIGNSQKVFIDLLIGQCTRMSLPERMQAVLTDDLACVVPPDESVFVPLCTSYIISGDGICSGKGTLATVADELMRRIFRREEAPLTLQWLEGAHESVDEAAEIQGWRLTLFVEALLCRGTTTGGTIWGMIGLMDRYHLALVEMSVSFDGAHQTITHTLFSCLYKQCALLHIILDTLMRRGVIAPHAIVSYLTQEAVPIPGDMHVSHVHTNQWVWRMVELAMDRCLDVAKAAMGMQNNSAHKQREAELSSGGMDDGGNDAEALEAGDDDDRQTDSDSRRSRTYPDKAPIVHVEISDEILEAVAAACEGSQVFYKVIVSHLLTVVQRRHAALVTMGEESASSVESGAVTSLDPCLLVNLSLLHKILRNFQMNEVGLQNSCAEGTSFPPTTDRSGVAQSLGDVSSDENGSDGLTALSGPARKIWQNYVRLP